LISDSFSILGEAGLAGIMELPSYSAGFLSLWIVRHVPAGEGNEKMASVTFDNATRLYPGGTRPAVDKISLEITDGEFLVLVGPSGCGKSTTLRMLAGLEEVNAGRILIGDRDVTDVPPKDRDIAMVFQNYALYPHMTVAENMGFALKIAGVAKEERAARVLEAAKLLDLEPYLARKPKALSGGQRQRVAMGRAIVRKPQVFLMDEPLSNLDAKLRVQTRTQIASLQRRLGVTTVYVTHDQVEAMTMGDRVAVLKDGLLQQVATPRELYETPLNVFVAGFIGSPAMNLLQLPIVDGGVQFGNVVLPIDANILSKTNAKTVTVGIRPEGLHVTANEGISVEVDVVEELGADGFLYGHTNISGADQDITARVDGRVHPNAGEKVFLKAEGGIIHLFDVETGERLN
jgi:multiple sugar transport system ATP-binding protein